MGRTLWLDGLRGIAAAIVTLQHAFTYELSSVFGFLFRSYSAEPPEENHHLIQLPPFRLLFAGTGMVSLFMVISGFAISISLLKARNNGSTGNGALIRRLCSAATRRFFRIYIPVTCITLISHALFFSNLYYTRPESQAQLWDLKPLTAPLSHIKFFFWYLLHLMDTINHGIDINTLDARPDALGLNYQLWTMPIEYRGSCVVYLLILTSAFWRPQPRRLVHTIVTIYWFYIGEWDLFCFLAGLWLAERNVSSSHLETEGEIMLPCDPLRAQKQPDKPWAWLTGSTYFNQIWTIICFALGTYLLCIPDDEPLGSEYQFLRVFFQSPNWNSKEIMRRSWSSVGAVLWVYAIEKSAYLQMPLNSRPVQYLGRISFPMYLLHMAVYRTLQKKLQDIFWFLAVHKSYPGAVEASKYPLPFNVAWAGSLLVCGMVTIVMSNLWDKYVDRKCLILGTKFEQWISQY